MLIFRSEDHIDRWCMQHNLARGATITPTVAWRLARAWYQNKVRPDWRRHTLAEAEALFASLDLTTPFWNLG